MGRPDDIPEDIHRAATVAVVSFETRIQSGDFASLDPDGTEAREALIAEVERAILAERERCAAETDNLHAGEFVDEVYAEGYFTALDLVAAAIRNGGV